MRVAPPLAFLPLLFLFDVLPAESQLIRGTITDRVSGEPVASASVLVLNPDTTVRAATYSDTRGNFTIRPLPGRFFLFVERVGYLDVSSVSLPMERTDTLNFTIRLPPEAIPLDSLTVVAQRRRINDEGGFYRRQGRGMGRFLGPVDVDRRRPSQVSDLLQDIPGFTVTPTRGGNAVAMTGRGRNCLPTVYVDGSLAFRGAATSRVNAAANPLAVLVLDALVNVRQVRAVEVYRDRNAAPPGLHARMTASGGDCGVIALWTRHTIDH